MMIIYMLLLTSSLLQSGDLTDLLYDNSSDDSASETEEENKPQLIATDLFRKGMWGTEDYPVKKYRYNSEKPQFITNDQFIEGIGGTVNWPVEKCRHNTEKLTELTESEVLNPFWSKLRNGTQEQKDNLLLEIASMHISDFLYLAKRKNIAAAVFIGANLEKIQSILSKTFSSSDLLCGAVLFNDLPLTRLLLTHNYPCTRSTFLGEPIIFYARTVAIARLLIQYGAKTDARCSWNRTLLHKVTDSCFEPALISLYRYHGASPMETDKDGETPLSLLLNDARQDHFIKKAALLLVGLTPHQKIALLEPINMNEKKYSPRMLTSLKNFLKRAEEQSLRKIAAQKKEEQPQEESRNISEKEDGKAPDESPAIAMEQKEFFDLPEWFELPEWGNLLGNDSNSEEGQE